MHQVSPKAAPVATLLVENLLAEMREIFDGEMDFVQEVG